MPYHIGSTSNDCYENTCTLINKLNIRDEKQLSENEALITSLKAAELIIQSMRTDFDFSDYKDLHRQLFEDLYFWAGTVRTVPISKSSTTFAPPESIEELGTRIFSRLRMMDYFTDLSKNEFISEISDLYSSINYLHPFREGNGRTERVFFIQLIRNAGHDINYSAMNSDLLMVGSIQASKGVNDSLTQFFKENIIF